MNSKRNFKRNTEGLVLVSIIAIVFLFCINIIGLVGALTVNQIADAVTPDVGSDVRAYDLVQNCRNVYIVTVVLADVLMLVWWAVSAQRKESQEAPQFFPY